MEAPMHLSMHQTRTLLRARCRDCRYPLRDLAESRCPECGREFDADDISTLYFADRTLRAFLVRHPGYLFYSIALVMVGFAVLAQTVPAAFTAANVLAIAASVPLTAWWCYWLVAAMNDGA